MRRVITNTPRVAMACVVSLALLLVSCTLGANSGGCPKSSREKPLSNLEPISCTNWELKISTAKLVPNDVILQANPFNDVSDSKSWIVVEATLRYDGSETGRVSDAISSSSFLMGSKNVTYRANDRTPTFTNLQDEFAPIPYDASNPYSGGTVRISMWFWVDNDDKDFVLGLFVGDGDAEEPNVWINVSTSAASPTPTDAGAEGIYEVGDLGPGGGLIFFVDNNDQLLGVNYLEATPTDLGAHSWGEALRVANAYRGGGLADWRLPTLAELSLLYLAKGLVGGFSYDTYWSSSEKDADYAFSQYFVDGEQSSGYPKYVPFGVRLVRSFYGSSSVLESSTDAGAEVAYKVGDIGPGGGIIVLVYEEGFSGDVCLMGTCQYIEMAPTDLEGQYSWDDAIVAAEAFSTLSANDWVLPSKDALNEMCKFAYSDTVNDICNDNGIGSLSISVGGFVNDIYATYWSSSEYGTDSAGTRISAWVQNFGSGGQGGSLLGDKFYVRPVRAF